MATRPSGKRRNSGDGPKKMSGEFRSGPIAGTAVISRVTFQGKGVHYADVDGLAMFEGDIVLGNVADFAAVAAAADAAAATADASSVMQPQFSIGITGAQFRWPNATVPYDIDPALPNPQRVRDAIAQWEANTNIRFVLRTPANAAQFPDFMHVVPGGGCSSMVGRQGGSQNVTLAPNCTSGNAIHEIGHTIGLWHEQSREDRNNFVRIVFANIDPAMQHNFLQHISDGDDLGPYDYGSIMHYPRDAFSTNGQDTIVPRQTLPPGVVMGQRTRLTTGDINGVRAMYPSAVPTIKEAHKDPFADPTIKEVQKDPIADPTIKEVHKDPIADPTIKEVHKDPIADTIKEAHKDPFTDTIKEGIHDTLFEGTFPGGPVINPGTPFVVASPSRALGADQQGGQTGAQIQDLNQAIAVVGQQQAELIAAYDLVLRMLGAMSQGQ